MMKLSRMRVAALALALTAGGCLPSPGDLGTTAVPSNLMPDPEYRPNVGDRAVLYAVEKGAVQENIPLVLDATAHDKYERLRGSGTVYDLTELEERRELRWTPSGTRVIVLAVHDRSHTGSRLAAEVRLIDGPHKGCTLWTALEHLTRFKAPEAE